MSVRVRISTFAVLSFVSFSAAAQDPADTRTSLIITEVMPNPSPGHCPWIELFNPSDHPTPLGDLVFKTGPHRSFSGGHSSFLATFGDLQGRAHLVIFMQPVQAPPSGKPGYSNDGSHCRATQSGVLVLDQRPALFAPESSVTGEISLYRDTSSGPEYLDYVAWGKPGADWSADVRKSRWPEQRFISFDNSFGVSQPNVRIPRDWSIGCYPGATCDRPEDWVLYDSVEIEEKHSQGAANPVPRPEPLRWLTGRRLEAIPLR